MIKEIKHTLNMIALSLEIQDIEQLSADTEREEIGRQRKMST